MTEQERIERARQLRTQAYELNPNRIDLDELERKARAATPGRWRWGMGNVEGNLGRVNCLYTADAERQRPVIALDFDSLYTTLADDTAHIAANSPPVALALIARIRELEEIVRRCHEMLGGVAVPVRDWELVEILEKGAVLP